MTELFNLGILSACKRLADILVGLFERVGLKTNTSKTQAMVCTPGKMWRCQNKAVYNRRMMGVGEAERYHGRRVKCDICGDALAARSLQSHLATQQRRTG